VGSGFSPGIEALSGRRLFDFEGRVCQGRAAQNRYPNEGLACANFLGRTETAKHVRSIFTSKKAISLRIVEPIPFPECAREEDSLATLILAVSLQSRRSTPETFSLVQRSLVDCRGKTVHAPAALLRTARIPIRKLGPSAIVAVAKASH
jgi:hypothetical protein